MMHARFRAAGVTMMAVAAIAATVGSTTARAAASEPAAPNASAVVVLVGATARAANLPDLLTDLLSRKDITVRFVYQPAFRADDLLAPGDGGGRSVSVFIEVPSDRVARLSFRGPRADRFLLRELGLRNGLDDVGREAVAQVVDSSVAVLLSVSSEGMSRDEARATLANAPVPPPPPGTVVDLGPRPALPAPSLPPPAAVTQEIAATPAAGGPAAATAWRGWVAPRYELAYAGHDLGAAHGPGLEAALERGGATLLVRARVVAERRFAQVVTTPALDANIQDDSARLLLEVGLPRGARQAVSLGIGPGVDVTEIQPGTARVSTVTPAGATTHVVPVVRGELRYEIGGAAWRVGALLFIDASLFDTHYDLDRAGVAQRLATPWPVRPGAAVVVGWRI